MEGVIRTVKMIVVQQIHICTVYIHQAFKIPFTHVDMVLKQELPLER